MSELSEYFKIIFDDRYKAKRLAIRAKIEAKGPPDAIVITDKEDEEELRMWKIEGGVTVIPFRKGKANIDVIVQHTDEYIDALEKCMEYL